MAVSVCVCAWESVCVCLPVCVFVSLINWHLLHFVVNCIHIRLLQTYSHIRIGIHTHTDTPLHIHTHSHIRIPLILTRPHTFAKEITIIYPTRASIIKMPWGCFGPCITALTLSLSLLHSPILAHSMLMPICLFCTHTRPAPIGFVSLFKTH